MFWKSRDTMLKKCCFYLCFDHMMLKYVLANQYKKWDEKTLRMAKINWIFILILFFFVLLLVAFHSEIQLPFHELKSNEAM